MNKALDHEFREIILSLKEAVFKDDSFECPSIQIYRAVLEYGIDSISKLKKWLPRNPLTGVVTDWKPNIKNR